MHTQKLKLGLLVDSFNVPAWVYDVIQRIENRRSSEFVLVVLNEDKGEFSNNKLSTSIYSIFNRIDEKLFTKEPDPFTPKSIAEIMLNVPIIKVLPLKNGYDWVLSESDVGIIKRYKLDILIKFGFEKLSFETLNASKYGTWFYYHGDDRKLLRGGPPGFWEVVENWPETSSALLAAGGEFSLNRVLFRSHFFTYPLSPARHRSYYYWATTSFLPRQIEHLQKFGKNTFWQYTEKFNTPPLPKIRRYETPSNILALISFGKIILKLIKEFVRRIFFTDLWFLLFSLKQDISDTPRKFIELRPSKEKFWADPHITRVNGTYYIFIEEFIKKKNKGHISVIELDELGNWKAPIKVLEKDYHLSYPFIFEWNDKYYMVPESRANKTIDLYECSEFPHKWIFKQCLIRNVSAVDTTLVYFSNKWWLFTALAENEAAAPNVELFLFYTDDLFKGDWKAHSQNPIISDIKSARPAGSLFVKEGKLIRPSQDCSREYGYGFDLNEIEVLSETEYFERRTMSIRPNWDKRILATHTYANCGKLTVIDAFTRILK
jgi:hypothetical protein